MVCKHAKSHGNVSKHTVGHMIFIYLPVQWLDLHLVQKIPASLLLLSRALYLPDDTPASDALQVTLSKLPESIVRLALT